MRLTSLKTLAIKFVIAELSMIANFTTIFNIRFRIDPIDFWAYSLVEKGLITVATSFLTIVTIYWKFESENFIRISGCSSKAQYAKDGKMYFMVTKNRNLKNNTIVNVYYRNKEPGSTSLVAIGVVENEGMNRTLDELLYNQIKIIKYKKEEVFLDDLYYSCSSYENFYVTPSMQCSGIDRKSIAFIDETNSEEMEAEKHD